MDQIKLVQEKMMAVVPGMENLKKLSMTRKKVKTKTRKLKMTHPKMEKM